jgi:ABC-type phosphate transport system permease subunit
MAQARNVGETLAVQQQLSQVQEQIEQITGRLNVLKTLTSLSTISMHIFEPGAAGAPVPPDQGPSFAKAWHTAVEGLLRIATVAMIAALWLAPFAILAAVVLAFRRTRPGAPEGAAS